MSVFKDKCIYSIPGEYFKSMDIIISEENSKTIDSVDSKKNNEIATKLIKENLMYIFQELSFGFYDFDYMYVDINELKDDFVYVMYNKEKNTFKLLNSNIEFEIHTWERDNFSFNYSEDYLAFQELYNKYMINPIVITDFSSLDNLKKISLVNLDEANSNDVNSKIFNEIMIRKNILSREYERLSTIEHIIASYFNCLDSGRTLRDRKLSLD